MEFAEFLGQQAHLISIWLRTYGLYWSRSSGGNGATQINTPIIEKSLLMLCRLHGMSYLGHGYIGGRYANSCIDSHSPWRALYPLVIFFLSTLSTYMYIWNSLIKIFYRWCCCRGVLKFHVSLVAKHHSQRVFRHFCWPSVLFCNIIQSNPYISLAWGPGDPMLLEWLCVYRGFTWTP